MGMSQRSEMLGEECCKNSACVAGNLREIAGLNCYVTGPVDSKLAILIISDAVGYETPNLRKLADKVAATGYFVVVPDFFYGEPFRPKTWSHDVKTWYHEFQTWLTNHGADKGCEDAKAVVEALKSRGVSAIGAAGFCWGGMVVPKLAKYEGTIEAAVLLHPSRITVDEINEVKVPTAILAAEHDQFFPADEVKKLGDVVSAKPDIESYVKIFLGAKHGWTTHYDVFEDESAVKDAEEAHSDMINWFTTFIK